MNDELVTSRREIETLMILLNEWIRQNPDSDKKEAAEQFLLRLEYMHMCW